MGFLACIGVWMMPGDTALTRIPATRIRWPTTSSPTTFPPWSARRAPTARRIGVLDQRGGDAHDVAAAVLEHRGDHALGGVNKPVRFTPTTVA